jgi:hypothetical protein
MTTKGLGLGLGSAKVEVLQVSIVGKKMLIISGVLSGGLPTIFALLFVDEKRCCENN